MINPRSESEKVTSHKILSSELLTEVLDEKLQSIVEEAAKDLDTPIALVTLVMEHIQFFKAHYGLPEDLAQIRGTDRDVSFCQYVVGKEQPLIVEDARRDALMPQELVEKYDVIAYMGMPIRVNGNVVGSLCVIDTKPRVFSSEQKRELEKLALLVNARLDEMVANRKLASMTMIENATMPALAEIDDAFKPIQYGINSGFAAVRELTTFLNVAERAAYGKIESKEEILRPLARAKELLNKYTIDLYNMEASLGDAADSLKAISDALHASVIASLSDIAISGRELARHHTAGTGGVFLPDFPEEILVSASNHFGVTMVTTALTLLAENLQLISKSEQIHMHVSYSDHVAELIFGCKRVNAASLESVAKKLEEYAQGNPSVRIQISPDGLILQFTRVQRPS